MKAATTCVRIVDDADPYRAVVPPLYQTATFRQESALEFGEYDYTRTANPTRTLVENHVARLEGGRFACAFSSGMAALTAVTRLLEPGDEVVAGDDLYGGTVRLLDRVVSRNGVAVKFVDTTDLAAVGAAVGSRTRMILVETPSNPLLRVSDVRSIAGLAHEVGALLVVDNSMMSPYLQRPLELGADIVVHSATKLLCGHSDVTAGVVVTQDDRLAREIAFHLNAEGAGLAPFEAWLLLRGMRTLALRVDRQCESASTIAAFLEAHPAIERVFYPGLPTHPGRHVHASQADAGGALVSFTTGSTELSRAIAESTRLFALTVSFGSVTSSIGVPSYMSHASVPEALRGRLGPPCDLVRVSVGIEDVDDLIDDLSQALLLATNHTNQLCSTGDEDSVFRGQPFSGRIPSL